MPTQFVTRVTNLVVLTSRVATAEPNVAVQSFHADTRAAKAGLGPLVQATYKPVA